MAFLNLGILHVLINFFELCWDLSGMVRVKILQLSPLLMPVPGFWIFFRIPGPSPTSCFPCLKHQSLLCCNDNAVPWTLAGRLCSCSYHAWSFGRLDHWDKMHCIGQVVQKNTKALIAVIQFEVDLMKSREGVCRSQEKHNNCTINLKTLTSWLPSVCVLASVSTEQRVGGGGHGSWLVMKTATTFSF